MADEKPKHLFGDPTPAELEIVHDEVHIAEHGRPRKRTPAEGIHDMEARIRLLQQEKQSLLTTIDDNFSRYDNDVTYRTGLDNGLAKINESLREAEARLSEYKAQQQGLN